jgi:hypothetical protein
MNTHPVDMLLRMAFLEGLVNTHGAWEQEFFRRKHVEAAPSERAARLERRLVAAMSASIRGDVLTVGSFLRTARARAGLAVEDLTVRLGLTGNIYRMLERDRISPLRISPDVWRRFRILWNIPLEVLEGMIRRSHVLFVFRPSCRATLARYHRRAETSARSAAMQEAATELYSRAQLELPPGEEAELQQLLQAIRGGFPE